MATEKEINDQAAKDLATEKSKYGFGPRNADSTDQTELESESEDMGDLEDTEDESASDEDTEEEDTEEEDDADDDDSDEDDESDEDSEDDSDEDEDDEEDEDDDSEKDQSRKRDPKKVFKKYNEIRKEKKVLLAKIDELNTKLEASLPDDFQDRVAELTKDLGVQDPAGLEKVIKFIKEFAVDKNVKKLEDKITTLQKQVDANKVSSVVDEFPKEWETFEASLKKEYPNATPEQLKAAKKEMEKLSKTKNVGGKAYIDKESGMEVLDPYPLDYIFYKHKDTFSVLVGGKKRKAMESAHTNRQTDTNKDGEVQHLAKNAPASDIRKLDKKYSKLESGAFEQMRSPVDNTI